jgi:hypothetical protein
MMHNTRTLAAVAVAALLLVACASTPAAKYSQLNDAFIAVTTTLVEARSVGMIEDEDWNQIVPLIDQGSDLLDQQRQIVDNGGDPYMLEDMIDTVIDQLLMYAYSVKERYEDG